MITGDVVNKGGLHKVLLHMPYENIKLDDNLEYSTRGKYSVNRRVIVSTSVAETGLTLDELGYVIDAGFDRKSESYPPYNINALTTKPATLANVMQRRGRAGRKFPGKFYAVYTKETFDNLSRLKLPSVIVDNTEAVLVKIMAENEDFEIEKIDLFDPPPLESLKQSLETCLVLGYADLYPKLHLTPMGKLYALMPKTEMHWFRVLMSAYAYNLCTADFITMASMAGTPGASYKTKPVRFPEIFKSMK